MVTHEQLTTFVDTCGYDKTLPEYRVESKPNPWLANKSADPFEIDCAIHPASECVVTHLHTVYYTDKYATLVAESACGHLTVWMD